MSKGKFSFVAAYTNTQTKIIVPAHDKTYNNTCVSSKDSDQPVHPPSIVRLLIYLSLDSLEAVEYTCDQQNLCADAQVDLCLRWSHRSYCRFYRALALK